MAREYELIATLRFQIDSQSEYDSMRTTVTNFTQNRSGTAQFNTFELVNGDLQYRSTVKITLPCTGRGQANTYMTNIDNALPTLPDLTDEDGVKLRYLLVETEV